MSLFKLWNGKRLVCEGVVFSDESVAIRWLELEDGSSTSAWERWSRFRYHCLDQFPERHIEWIYNPWGGSP